MKRILSLTITIAWVSLGCMAAGSESKKTADSEAIALFNGRDLTAWHIYLDDADADPKTVFQVKDGALWCKGTPTGFIRTKAAYSDFKLVVEWRWPEKPGNSGVLVRMTDEDKVWPFSMEAQLKHQSAGDVVGMGCDFNENTRPASEFYRHAPRQHPSNEKKPGEWNTYEITCKGDTMELTVNGQLQNKATGVAAHGKGYIGLQSEGAPIMFRNIKLTTIR